MDKEDMHVVESVSTSRQVTVPASSEKVQEFHGSSEAPQSEEIIIIDLEPLKPYLKPAQRRREDPTRRTIAMILIITYCGVVVSYWILSIWAPSRSDVTNGVFEKICFVLGPLVGFVLGWYFNRLDGQVWKGVNENGK